MIQRTPVYPESWPGAAPAWAWVLSVGFRWLGSTSSSVVHPSTAMSTVQQLRKNPLLLFFLTLFQSKLQCAVLHGGVIWSMQVSRRILKWFISQPLCWLHFLAWPVCSAWPEQTVISRESWNYMHVTVQFVSTLEGSCQSFQTALNYVCHTQLSMMDLADSSTLTLLKKLNWTLARLVPHMPWRCFTYYSWNMNIMFRNRIQQIPKVFM